MKRRYDKAWRLLRASALERAGRRCERRGANCAKFLDLAFLDGDRANTSKRNVRIFCRSCRLSHDAPERAAKAAATRRRRRMDAGQMAIPGVAA